MNLRSAPPLPPPKVDFVLGPKPGLSWGTAPRSLVLLDLRVQSHECCSALPRNISKAA